MLVISFLSTLILLSIVLIVLGVGGYYIYKMIRYKPGQESCKRGPDGKCVKPKKR